MVVQTGNLIMKIITCSYNRSRCYNAISSGLVGATEIEKKLQWSLSTWVVELDANFTVFDCSDDWKLSFPGLCKVVYLIERC